VQQKLEMEPEDEIISYSSVKNNNQQQIWNVIAKYL
ncbi:YihA family ribosome biogenesis GTP-binding protein, partial [Staphylococcus xylosus]